MTASPVPAASPAGERVEPGAAGRPADFLFLLLVLSATAGAFLPSLFGGFVFDEHNLVLGNPHLGELSQIPAAFFRLEEETAVVSHDIGTIGRYRPLPTCLGILAFRQFGLNPIGWHVLNLALYLLAITALHSVFRRLHPDPWVYRPATLWFALHPVHAEVVAWVANFGNTLLVMAFSMALWFHLDWRENGSRRSMGLSVAFLLAALFAREGALVFPLVVVLHGWLYGGGSAWTRLRGALGAMIPACVAEIGYLVVRYAALGGSLRLSVTAVVPWSTALLSVPDAVLSYVRLLLLPVGLSPVYPFSWVGAADDPRFWGGLLVVLSLAAITGLLFRENDQDRPAGFLGLGMTAACLLPFLNLRALSPELAIQDRYLVLPSIGFCLVVALMFRQVALRSRLPRASRLVVVLAVASGLGWLSFQQSQVWGNDLDLFTRAVAVSPRSSLAHQNLGMALLQAGRFDQARDRFRYSIALGNPAAGFAGLGDAAFAQGSYPEAVESYEQSLAAGWNFSANLLRNLGLAYFRSGDEDQALRSFELLASHFPGNAEGFLHAGLLLIKRGEFRTAVERLRQAATIDPANADTAFFLGEAYQGLGWRPDAIAAYRACLSLKPGSRRARARLEDLAGPATATVNGGR